MAMLLASISSSSPPWMAHSFSTGFISASLSLRIRACKAKQNSVESYSLHQHASNNQQQQKRKGPDLQALLRRVWNVAAPYWSSEDKVQARLRLAGVFALTLGTTGISVGFNFLGRDFYNALASKNQEQFTVQLLYYLAAFIGGIPVFVLRDYGKETLALRWRAWMTSYYLNRYFEGRTFYTIQSQSLIDNPDQRIVDDVNSFTGTALSFALALFNAAIDLISFSGILFGIYPPLFLVLLVYSLGGTAISFILGKNLVNLNFLQEKKEADFRYGLVRIRENAESIAFYGGERNEIQLLLRFFKQSFENFSELLVATRNLEFFTSGYRYLIQILPAAIVAPMYFSGKIEFGVINQSYSAFNHVLSDFSIIVYQFQSLSAFSAVIVRLGEFKDVLDQQNRALEIVDGKSIHKPLITLIDIHEPILEDKYDRHHHPLLLGIEHLTIQTPQYTTTLVNDLSIAIHQEENLLIMGSSGSGKTSLLRAIAGLWRSGTGIIKRYLQYEYWDSLLPNNLNSSEVQNTCKNKNSGPSSFLDQPAKESDQSGPALDNKGLIFFLPQRPYMILGTLRQQLLYPTWTEQIDSTMQSLNFALPSAQPDHQLECFKGVPTDEELAQVLRLVRLDNLMARYDGLNSIVEWASVLSLGEQQRLAFARVLLSRPKLALLDEATSALDERTEAHLYAELQNAAITYISVGHRSSLRKHHTNVLKILDPETERIGQNWVVESIEIKAS